MLPCRLILLLLPIVTGLEGGGSGNATTVEEFLKEHTGSSAVPDWSKVDGLMPKEYLKTIENTKWLKENITMYLAVEGLSMAMVDSMGHLLNAKHILLEEFQRCACPGAPEALKERVTGPAGAEDLQAAAGRVQEASATLAERFARAQACSGAALCTQLLRQDHRRLLTGRDDAGYQTALWQDVLIRIAPEVFKPIMEDRHYKRILNSYLAMLLDFNSAEKATITQPTGGFIYMAAQPPGPNLPAANTTLNSTQT